MRPDRPPAASARAPQRGRAGWIAAWSVAVVLCATEGAAGQQWRAAPSALAVHSGQRWQTWWRSDQAPDRWRAGLTAVAGAADWRSVGAGVEWSELRIADPTDVWRVRLIAVRIDPRRVRLELVSRRRAGGARGAWTVDSLPPGAVLGVNAGQFAGGTPWGWVVRGGRERQPPGSGPLSMAVTVDRSGRLRLVPYEEIGAVRAAGDVAEAFQTYPALLVENGTVPLQLRAPGRGVDLEHRDSRVAIGELRDGRILLVLTRLEGLGGLLEQMPLGPTTPEMAALMGALGCRRAAMLDGGLSGQLAIRDRAGRLLSWPGLRRVPLGLVAHPRE